MPFTAGTMGKINNNPLAQIGYQFYQRSLLRCQLFGELHPGAARQLQPHRRAGTAAADRQGSFLPLELCSPLLLLLFPSL